MSEPRYYTPSIEEFHFGFEYEEDNSVAQDTLEKPPLTIEWYKSVYGTEKAATFSELWYTKLLIEGKNVRVKFLDKSDVESLGWYAHPQGGFAFNCEEKTVRLWFSDLEKCIIEIYTEFIEKSEYKGFMLADMPLAFNGTIKNKSEMKRLMKQMHMIKEDETSL